MIATYYQQELSMQKKVRFRAKVSRSGRKIQILIPSIYHDDIIDSDFLGKVVQVEVTELPKVTTGNEI
jgi:hypothetical protein